VSPSLRPQKGNKNKYDKRRDTNEPKTHTHTQKRNRKTGSVVVLWVVVDQKEREEKDDRCSSRKRAEGAGKVHSTTTTTAALCATTTATTTGLFEKHPNQMGPCALTGRKHSLKNKE